MAPKLRGEGWVVWAEEDVVWTKRTGPQHALSAAARAAAIARVLGSRPVKGVIVDERQLRGPDTPSAQEAFASFVVAHKKVPVAIVTTDPATAAAVRELRQRSGAENIRFFKSVQAAKAWLRKPEP